MATASWENLIRNPEPQGHVVQLHGPDDRLLTTNVGHYLWEGLKRGDGLLVIATPQRRDALWAFLRGLGADPEGAVRDGRVVFLEAHETLRKFMVDGQPDWRRFEHTIRVAMRQIRGAPGHTEMRAYGEMVGLLWQAGEFSAAVRLEQFWNRLLHSNGFSLFCAYPINVFEKEFRMSTVDDLLCAHTHLIPSYNDGDLVDAIHRAMDDALGPKAQGLRQVMKPNYRPSWAALPKAEALILWLRNNVPDPAADAILAQARQYLPVI